MYIADFVEQVSIWALTVHNYTGMERCLLGICKKALETARAPPSILKL